MAVEVDGEDVEEDIKDRLLPDVLQNNEKQGTQDGKIITYIQCYFVTIAATLGTGILGLPVKLANSGFTPFVVVFVLGFFAQVLVVYYFVEILQKAFVIRQDKARKDAMLSYSEGVPLNGLTEDVLDDSNDEQDKEIEMNRQEYDQPVTYHSDSILSLKYYPSLHSLAELFLGPGLQQCFDLALVLVFISCLISYSLAGSQAFAQLGHFELLYVIPIFTWTCSFIIIFLQACVTPFVSFLTFCKGSLFTACILAAMYVGYFVQSEITEDIWSAGEPFLLGTVAIGGIMNIMPMIFTKIQLQAKQVVRFRLAINAGLGTCMILNILWCYAVLEVVPQKECEVSSPVVTAFTTISNITTTITTASLKQSTCSKNGSLQWAEANGQISTIPLTEILHTKYIEFTWIAFLIQIFVMISITVSYLTFGAALRHMLEGWLDSFFISPNNKKWQNSEPQKTSCCNKKYIVKILLLFLVFGFVFTVAMFNPKAFIVVMERVTSFIINLECVLIITVMLRRTHASKYRHLGIPVRISQFLHYLSYPVACYFMFAVGYDIYEVILHLVHSQIQTPHRPPPYHNIHNATLLNNNTTGLLPIHNRRWRVFHILTNGTH